MTTSNSEKSLGQQLFELAYPFLPWKDMSLSSMAKWEMVANKWEQRNNVKPKEDEQAGNGSNICTLLLDR